MNKIGKFDTARIAQRFISKGIEKQTEIEYPLKTNLNVCAPIFPLVSCQRILQNKHVSLF